MSGKLYLCPTPIGNLRDITLRVIETLSFVDIVAAEDTRRSRGLLTHLGIKKPLISYYEHNKRQRGEEITALLLEGKNVALVTDAGTPAISDPGEDLVALCIEKGIETESLPGPSALITALTLSGLPTGRFSFQGFLSTNKRSRKEHLISIKESTETLIFYEAPHKLKYTLHDLSEHLGDRRIALCRELTKIHEEIIRTTLFLAKELYEETPPKGEFVLVIDGCRTPSKEPESEKSLEEIYAMLLKTGIDSREALKQAAKEAGISKREAYQVLKV